MAAVECGGSAPLWVDVLTAAREWGTPPWELAGGDRLRWFFRWQEWTQLVMGKRQRDLEELNG